MQIVLQLIKQIIHNMQTIMLSKRVLCRITTLYHITNEQIRSVHYINLLPDGKTKLNEIIIPVNVSGKDIMFIVETGATKSLINAEGINEQIKDGKTRIEPTNIQVTVATGEKAEVLGTV
jgi:hypothetical protein